MILGHLTVTYVAGKQLEKAYPILAQTPALIFGALLPDLIDKPLAMISEIPSRGLFHSVPVLSLLFLILVIALPRRRETVMAVGVGLILHLIEDMASPAIILWPLLGGWPEVQPIGLVDKLAGYYLRLEHPYHFAVEAVSYPFFVWLLLKRKVSPQSAKGIEETVNLYKE